MEIKETLDHLFRREYRKMVAHLTNKFSSAHLDLIEDAVQETLLKAMQLWSYQPLPGNPSAWLFRVANNYIIDQLRRAKKTVQLDFPEFSSSDGIESDPNLIGSEIADDQLKMIFACCHPSLKAPEQIMLSLKLLCGLSVREIARSLMKNEEAVKKAISRAKKKFQTSVRELTVPEGRELRMRLDRVMKVIYLLFNEGYKATEGERLIKKDICEEAIRLALILQQNRHCNTPELNALLALMCFNASRLNARLDAGGELITLEHQDRTLWERQYIEWGLYFLSRSSNGVQLSEYHLEAGIASFYCTAASFKETNWQAILSLYDLLIKVNHSPMVALNRVVVLGKVRGSAAARKEIARLEKHPRLRRTYLLYSIKADLELSEGNQSEAARLLEQAIQLAGNRIEIDFLKRKLSRVELEMIGR